VLAQDGAAPLVTQPRHHFGMAFEICEEDRPEQTFLAGPCTRGFNVVALGEERQDRRKRILDVAMKGEPGTLHHV
jgi:hypothetical protein